MIADQLIAILAAILACVIAWFMDRQGIRHAHERELWRSERQILQGRALKPMPSLRRPENDVPEYDLTQGQKDTIREAKLAELRRLAATRPTLLDVPVEVRRSIVQADF